MCDKISSLSIIESLLNTSRLGSFQNEGILKYKPSWVYY